MEVDATVQSNGVLSPVSVIAPMYGASTSSAAQQYILALNNLKNGVAAVKREKMMQMVVGVPDVHCNGSQTLNAIGQQKVNSNVTGQQQVNWLLSSKVDQLLPANGEECSHVSIMLLKL